MRYPDGEQMPRLILALILLNSTIVAQNTRLLAPGTRPFISVDDAVVALTHVRMIDGTGAPALPDQTIIFDHNKILTIGSTGSVQIPTVARVIDLNGHSVMPGIVGMHEHLFYPSGGRIPIYNEHAFSFPRLYLASGVTTMRTAGSLEPYTDLEIKKLIDAGRMPGPKMFVTGPYLEGKGSFAPQMHELGGPEDAVRTVEYWVAEGATSFKAYMNITRAELKAAIDTAHKHGIKVTGHLCSVGFREAAVLGIDNLEHGLWVDTEFAPGKQPDVCPVGGSIAQLDVDGPGVQETIRALVKANVAITSTLAVFEAFVAGRPALDERFIDALSEPAAISYLTARGRATDAALGNLRKEMQFERAFVKAGGLLMAGADPTGNGGALAGFADQRNLELLVEAGFTPLEAIQIATSNGARYLGESDRIGTIAVGKQADLVVVQGDPSTKIADIRRVKHVFKAGVGYDPAKLLESIRGSVGLH